MSKQFRVYKPKKTDDGSVSAWEISYKKDKYDRYECFLEMANQLPGRDANDNQKFDWDNKITVKLGALDIGEILLVLEGHKDSVGTKGKNSLFHKTSKGNKVINFSYSKEYKNFSLKISSQDEETKKRASFNQLISLAEGVIIRELLKSAIVKMYS